MSHFDERMRIDKMLAAGKISEQDHKDLISVLGSKSGGSTRFLSWAINPFESVSSGAALILGPFILLAMSFLGSKLGVYFPGVLDLQIVQAGKRSYNLTELLTQNLIAIFTLASVFYISAHLFKKRNLRFLDFAGFTALSRVPYALFVLILFILENISAGLLPRSAETTKGGSIIVLAVLAVVALVWQIVLLFSAQKNASGLKGHSLWISFVCSLVAAEAFSYGLNFLIL